MARRIEVELTSRRDDGRWTWRAAGARQPKGDLDGALLGADAAVGDVVRVDVEDDLDGIHVVNVLAPQQARRQPDVIEVLGPPRREPGVSTNLVSKGRGSRGDRRGGHDRGRRGDSEPRARSRRDGAGPDPDRRRSRRDDRRGAARSGPTPAEAPERPRAPRLRPGRAHRVAVVAELPPEQRALAEIVLRGGIPGVRQEIDQLNERARAAGHPEIRPEPLVTLAEQLLGPLRAAEWRDRAEAAQRQVEDLDLRDLRSVVVAADTAARDEESRAVAADLRDALGRRVEQEHSAWLLEVAVTLDEGRLVRALKLSSRPPKAGTPFPRDLGVRLAEAASAGLTADTGSDRYAAVLEAVALSPVRQQVEPQGVPADPNDALLRVVKVNAARLPQVAARFGIEPSPGRPRRIPPAPPPSPAPTSR